MTMTKARKAEAEAERETALAALREMYPVGSTVSTILRHTSSSGMTRAISVIREDQDISYWVARLGHYSLDSRYRGLRVTGAGMDMGFHLAYGLARALYPDGHYCAGRGVCPSNDHSNDWGSLARQYADAHSEPVSGDRDARTAYCVARGEWITAQGAQLWSPDRHHADGGYALNHRWI